MRRATNILLVTLFLSITSCGHRLANDGDMPVIDIVGNLKESTFYQVSMSEFVSDVEYVPLETRQNCMVDKYRDVIVTSTHIFISAYNFCYAFTRDGKFISDVGRKGRGPGEWPDFNSGISVDEEMKNIYLDTHYNLCEYTWDGKLVREFKKPEYSYGGEYPSKSEYAIPLGNGRFLGYTGSSLENMTPQFGWLIFDDKGEIVRNFKQHVRVSKDDNFLPGVEDASEPFVASDGIYVKEQLNDTLFVFDRLEKFAPKAVFSLGEYAFPHDVHLTLGNSNELYTNSIHVMTNLRLPLIVANNNLFFSLYIPNEIQSDFRLPKGVIRQTTLQGQPISSDDTRDVLGLYDMDSGKTTLLDRDLVSRRYGLVNDLDGGLTFWPRAYNALENTLVDVWEAYEMKELLTEEYFAAHPARDPAAHARLRELVKNLKEDDNPVIVIAKLKK